MISLIGTNHKNSPSFVREKLAFDNNHLDRYLLELKNRLLLDEVMILSTCNRVEVLFVAKEDKDDSAIEYLSRHSSIQIDELKKYLYIKHDLDAVEHIFEVASSLDSMVIGEPQILGQLKEAYKWSVEFYTSGATINRIMRRAFHAAKVVKTKTDIAKGAISLPYAAFLKTREIVDIENKNVVSIGSSEMNVLTVEYFAKAGAKITAMVNRTPEKVEEIAKTYNARVFSLNGLKEALKDADIIISATSSMQPIITKDLLPHKNLIIIDMAIPPDTEKSISNMNNVKVIFIDDLKDIVEQSLNYRKNQAERAKKIIKDELQEYVKYVESLNYDDVIKKIRMDAERIRSLEIYKFKKMYNGKLDDELLDGVDKLTRSILNKVLHEPTVRIKDFINHPEGDMYIELLRRIFNISKSKEDVKCFFSANN
ncbi:glutamyl-tRNA reductase [Hippea jasoniae]|uniref:glutamyl-tRNA reductase n=1 Tax=Hippea jasoniae TaxID=944479 RepID=UPI000557BA24|nr:glutamyl-tRNA reductase [Hippea jasoniae]